MIFLGAFAARMLFGVISISDFARAPRHCGGIRGGAAIVGVFCLCTLAHPSSAKEAEATFHVEVAAGEWKGARLKNIPAGTKLSVEASVDGEVEILLLTSEAYERSATERRPLFRGRTSDRLAFSVIAPKSGDYYVVIDNRAGSSSRSAELTVRGETGADAVREVPTPARSG